ncbi:hypothetical protein KAJ27_09520 [bacterium]|nr:hypothetical protein [bacterium]
MNFKTLLLTLFIVSFLFSLNLFSLDSDIRFKYKDDFFYKLYLDDYSPEMIELLENNFSDLEWAKLSEVDRKKLEELRKKLKNVLKKRNKRKSTISKIFSKMKMPKKSDEKIIKIVPLSDQVQEIDNKHEKLLESLKEK